MDILKFCKQHKFIFNIIKYSAVLLLIYIFRDYLFKDTVLYSVEDGFNNMMGVIWVFVSTAPIMIFQLMGFWLYIYKEKKIGLILIYGIPVLYIILIMYRLDVF